jgi:hypothetical protein
MVPITLQHNYFVVLICFRLDERESPAPPVGGHLDPDVHQRTSVTTPIPSATAVAPSTFHGSGVVLASLMSR